MPRIRRVQSEANIYHVILRGINKQIIFEEDYDYTRFLQLLTKVKSQIDFELYAYCLMNNHVHLLIGADDLPTLATIMKCLGIRFVKWYNAKYQRSGHLFQDRFRSEPVNTLPYFLTVLRYIHNNPVKAGLVRQPTEYPWSSCSAYTSDKKNSIPLNVQLAFSFFNSRNEILQFFTNENPSDDSDECIDVENHVLHFTDEYARSMILQVSGCRNLHEFPLLHPKLRNQYLKTLGANGLSIRQLSRLCGIPKSTVSRIIAT